MKPMNPSVVIEKTSKEVLLALAAFIYESEISGEVDRADRLVKFIVLDYPGENYLEIKEIFAKDTLGEHVFSAINTSNADIDIFALIHALFAPYLGGLLEWCMGVKKLDIKIEWHSDGD